MPGLNRFILLAVFLLTPAAAGAAAGRTPTPQPPSVLFGDLYARVEMRGIFPDSKIFADAVRTQTASSIMADYAHARRSHDFDLGGFVAAHFTRAPENTVSYRIRPDEPVQDYIAGIWDVLLRQPDPTALRSSLLPLPYPYVVPGGRFSEIYYWDTYFTMLGLLRDGRPELARDMIRNLASLIDRYGHVPNGNRSYYLSRSEPPFFACMIDLIAAQDGTGAYLAYLPELQREYDYWMQGADRLAPGQAHRHVVRLIDGTVLNRYWDDRDTPRDESYREDVQTARASGRPASSMYRELRAGAETGWDFSSRWLGDGVHLDTIRTTSILPVDLNSLVAHMEQTLALAYGLRGDAARSAIYAGRARLRTDAINRLMFQPGWGAYADYVWTERKPSSVLSIATVLPLFFHLARADQADAVAATIRAKLLRPGGVATTLADTGQQWDSPNGWAPMQWMAIIGLRTYRQDELARTIAQRWIEREIAAYAQTGVLLEKYDVKANAGMVRSGFAGGHGGEYPLQVGFGWTNGVLVSLMQLYPERTAESLARHPQAGPERRARDRAGKATGFAP